MKNLSNDLEQHTLPVGTFGYSAASLEDLGATEYTLVTIVVDVSGSVSSYKSEMEKAIEQVVKACKYSPRSDNLMIRIVTFDNNMSEMHGFKLLADCDISEYDNCINIGGTTALYDAVNNAISATSNYAEKLNDSDFDANAIVVIITDGLDNSSNEANCKTVKETLKNALHNESLESLLTILVGVGVGSYPDISKELDRFKNESGLTQYIEIKDADASNLAKLAEFVSKSISATSNALGTGGPSQILQF